MKLYKEAYINSVNLNADTDFPYLVLNVINDRSYPRNLGFQVMHWHEDLQFIYVLRGSIELRTLDSSIRLSAGDGVFINKNIVHHVQQVEDCHYNSFLFPDYFLGFYLESPAKRFVDSVTEREQPAFVRFDREQDWCGEILSILHRLSELEKNKTEFYVYEVLVLLSQMWLEMRKNISLPVEKSKNATSRRMQKFLSYIEQHYTEDVSLEDLAQSANVSKSECLRCFKQSMETTPYKYLIEYRLSKAAAMLKSSDSAIEAIAASVGFRQVSHFGKCFREKTGMSPSEYRKHGGSHYE